MHQLAQDSQTCKLTLSSAMKNRMMKKTQNTHRRRQHFLRMRTRTLADQEVGTALNTHRCNRRDLHSRGSGGERVHCGLNFPTKNKITIPSHHVIFDAAGNNDTIPLRAKVAPYRPAIPAFVS